MAQFQFRGRDARGEVNQGTLDAATRDAAATELVRRGITPIAVTEIQQPKDVLAGLKKHPLFVPKITLDELIIMCRQMNALTRAGIPIIRAMRGLAESTRSEALKATLHDVTNRLESGVSLAASMQAHSKVFDELFISMIHVGENTGQLEQAFKQLSESLELERDTRKRIKQATRYPMIVSGALLGALMIINFFVIPKFAGVFAKFGAELPFATKILITTSNFFINYWWLLGGLSVGAVYAFKRWVKTPQGHYLWDKYKLGFPIVGGLFEQITLSRFSRNFAMMLGAGVTVTHALAIAAEAAHNKYIGTNIASMKTGIERGDSLLRTANATGMFTPLVLQMIAVGEETGSIDRLLNEVADFYDEEVDYGLKRLAESIEPILLLAMGAMVLVLALGVFLPIWDLGKAALK